jgi:hypothetical protein
LKSLRQVFKAYQLKNKRKVEQSEIENRSRNIDLLRKTLNLLQQEYQAQASRSKRDFKKSKLKSQDIEDGLSSVNLSIQQQSSATQGLLDIFGEKDGKGDDESETDLTEEEQAILKEFEKND